MPTENGVIFDVDGVLIDSYHAHLESWQLLASEIGRTCSEADFAMHFGRTSREIIIEQWPDRAWTVEEVTALDDRKESLFRQVIADHFPGMAGAADLIRSLDAAGFLIAVGSSGPPENVDLVLDKLADGNFVRRRITGRDVKRGKPDPQVFQLAASGLGLAPSRCCVIEDAPAGIEAAHRAGIICIGLASTGRTRPQLQAAECVVDSLNELTPVRIAELIQQGPRSRDFLEGAASCHR